MFAMERIALRAQVAGQRPSSLNVGGLIVVGRSSTRTGHTGSPEAAVRVAPTVLQ
jgi:hypothetical protein